MTNKNLEEFATLNWSKYIKSIGDISKNSDGVSLIDSSVEMYNFDEIVKNTFTKRDVPTSADGIEFKENAIYLVEFKSGFKQKITKDNFDEKIGTCEIAEKVCDDYWNLFWENQSRKIDQLIEVIKLKAIESYMLLEKHYFPQCECGPKRRLVFIVVIDEDAVDGIEDSMAEIAGVEPKSENCFKSIKQSLKRLTNLNDFNNDSYLYDEILVKSVVEYKKLIVDYLGLC